MQRSAYHRAPDDEASHGHFHAKTTFCVFLQSTENTYQSRTLLNHSLSQLKQCMLRDEAYASTATRNKPQHVCQQKSPFPTDIPRVSKVLSVFTLFLAM